MFFAKKRVQGEVIHVPKHLRNLFAKYLLNIAASEEVFTPTFETEGL